MPVLIGFLTFDSAESGLPFSVDALVLVSVLVWLVSYLTVPGTRGHAVYLGLAGSSLWLYVLDKAEPRVFSAGLVQVLGGASAVFGSVAGPDWNSVALLSLLFGLGYYAVAFVLDRLGRSGPGAALALGGFLATATGSAAAAVNLPAVGEGVLLIALGVILCCTSLTISCQPPHASHRWAKDQATSAGPSRGVCSLGWWSWQT